MQNVNPRGTHLAPNAAPDAPMENRPGVPMETRPKPAGNAHWITPEKQRDGDAAMILKRPELDALTPVYSTAVPPRGLSGAIRRAAYRIPDHKPSHWMLLLLSDRVDALEHDPARLAVLAVPIAAVLGVGLFMFLRPTRRAWWEALIS